MTFYRFVLSAALFFPAARAYSGEINFVYPAEGAVIPGVPKTFIFGNISPATAPFTINGEKVAVHPNGGFISYLPISEGDFSFRGELRDGTTAQRRLKVRQFPDARPAQDGPWLEFTSYASDSEVLGGEYLRAQVSGSPGREAVLSLDGVFKDEPMTETPPGSGRYYGVYQVKESDPAAGAALSARFRAGLFARGASARSKGKVRILKTAVIVETSTDAVVLRNAPDGGYMMFLPKGVKMVSTGKANGQRRVALSQDDSGWVDDSKVQLSSGAPYPFAPFTETGSIRLKKTDFGSSASVNIYEKVPFAAEEIPGGLRLTLYYANLHTNWVVYDSSDTLVKNVAFRQTAFHTVEIDFETAPGALWGYNISYSTAAKVLQVDLRSAPKPALSWPRPLAGLTIVLDPGHSPKTTSPYDGAVGPMGTFEYQVNLAIARRLGEKLSSLGAAVKLTRSGDENVALADRPKLAKDLGGDVFISVHNNAIGDGEDPFSQPRGYSIYHYQRHSRDLAAAVHRAYRKNIPLPDEGLRYGDYLVARMTWMPAILVENAYMILPRQEELLNSPKFQEQLAASMTEGVLEFFRAPPQSKKVKR